MSKLTQEQIDNLMDACLSDSTKIIRYLEDKEAEHKSSNRIQLILIVITFFLSLITFLINEAPKILDWLSSIIDLE